MLLMIKERRKTGALADTKLRSARAECELIHILKHFVTSWSRQKVSIWQILILANVFL